MGELGDLRQRVGAAIDHFKQQHETQHSRWENLRRLVDYLEHDLTELRERTERARRETERLSNENVELRSMLSSLLQYMEDDSVSRSLSDLEAKVARLESLTGTAASQPGSTVARQGQISDSEARPPSPQTSVPPASVPPASPARTDQSDTKTEKRDGPASRKREDGAYEQLVVRQITKLARALNEAKGGKHRDAEGDGRPKGKAAGK